MRDLGPERRGAWIGMEVEGRWSGIMTLFVSDPAVSVLETMKRRDVMHAYYLWEAWLGGDEDFWVGVLDVLAHHPVTFEVPFQHVSKLPFHIANHPSARIQVTIPIGDEALAAIMKIRETDEVRLDASPFNAVSVELRHLLITGPGDYDGDCA